MRRIPMLVAFTLLAAACASEGGPADPTISTPSTPPTTGGPAFLASSLQTVDRCDDLLAHFIEQGLAAVTPWGLPGDGWGWFPAPGAVRSEDGAGAPTGPPAVEHSTTNVQEVGVDEPDIIKTDGRHVFALVDGSLRIATVDGTDVSVLATVDFDGVHYDRLLLAGNRVVLFGTGWSQGPRMASDIMWPGWGSATSTILELDVTDPAAPVVLRRLQVDGSIVSARMVDRRVRLVTRSRPLGFSWVTPEGAGLRAERAALEANRELIRNSKIDQWLPYAVQVDGATGDEVEGQLVECDRVHLPTEPSGLSTVAITSFPLSGNGLASRRATGLVADADTIYASGAALYVATQQTVDWARIERGAAARQARDFTTNIHRFDITGPFATYQASGEVPGFLIGQWAMSEWDGDLRVASTTNPWGWWDSAESESELTVLRPDGAGLLARVGGVGGMGRTETIRAVRFIGPVGYIVTFRQTDPLYVIDVSDPANPVIDGELKINGYSAYLHPVGDGLLLGIGQDADDEGRVLGTQVSLFDVSDPRDPRRIDQLTIEGAWAEAEWDHQAFLWWGADGLAVAPYQAWVWSERGGGSSTVDIGALTVRVVDGGLVRGPTLRNGLDGPVVTDDGGKVDPWRGTIRRALVVGGVVLTVGEGGIGVHERASLETVSFVPWE
jgi:hypothetical protein